MGYCHHILCLVYVTLNLDNHLLTITHMERISPPIVAFLIIATFVFIGLILQHINDRVKINRAMKSFMIPTRFESLITHELLALYRHTPQLRGIRNYSVFLKTVQTKDPHTFNLIRKKVQHLFDQEAHAVLWPTGEEDNMQYFPSSMI